MICGYRFTALGCTGRIRVANVPRADADQVVAKAVRWLRATEAELSRFVPTSLVGQLNNGNVVAHSENLLSVLQSARHAQRLTAGRFSISAGPLWQLWHDANRTTWPTSNEIQSTRALCCDEPVNITEKTAQLKHPACRIDLGGVGKEWCVDQLADHLTAAGLSHVMVELGGDCAARGNQPQHDGWHVLLPGVAAAVTLHNEAIATSGIGTRGRLLAGQWIPHLVDAVSGLPATGVVRSASVIAKNCLDAGIRATDLCLLTDVSPLLITARGGGLPMWLRLASTSSVGWYADEQLAARMRPVNHRHDEAA